MQYITSSVRLFINLPDNRQLNLFGLEPKVVSSQMIDFFKTYEHFSSIKVENIPQMYKKKYIPNCLIKNPQAKILVIRYGGIGDVLWTTPAIRAIKEQYPLTKIKYCVSEKDREILYNNPYIDGVIATKFPRVSDLEWADFVLDFFDS